MGRKKSRGSMEGELLEYTINGCKIWHYFDPPHLIKSVRNNLLVKNLIHTVSFNETKFKPVGNIVWNEKNKIQRTASWADIVDFHTLNNDEKTGLFNLIPNITPDHLSPERRKMKVCLATQVFSGTCGRNMYLCWKRNQFKKDCIGTAAILLFFNDLFKHWLSTLKGIRRICEHLFGLGFTSVGLRRLNQDGLENHFFKVRSNCGSNPKPNARDFRNAYTTSVLNNQISNHSLNANCEDDKGRYMLQNLEILFTQHKSVSISQGLPQAPGDGNETFVQMIKNVLKDVDISSKSFIENEAQNCISGKICKIVLQKMKCVLCTATVEATKKDIFHDIMRKQSSSDEMVMPKVEFIACIKIWISRLQCMLPHFCAEKNLIAKVLTGMITILITFNG